MARDKNNKRFLNIHMGPYSISFKKTKLFFANLNDFFVSLWFMLGSVLYFFDIANGLKVVLYLIGSSQLMIKSILKLSKQANMEKK